MEEEFRIDGREIMIGDRRHHMSEIVAVASTIAGIIIVFRDGSSDVGAGSAEDFFAIRDHCPWAVAAI